MAGKKKAKVAPAKTEAAKEPETAETPVAAGAVEGVYRADLGESLPPQKKAGE